MISARLAIPIALLFVFGAAPQAGDTRIRKQGEARFEAYRDQDLDRGDILRTGSDALSFDYGLQGEIWIGPGTDVVYRSGMSLGLEQGEVVVQAGTGEAEIGTPGLLVIVGAASAQIEVDGDQTNVDRLAPRRRAAGEDAGVVIEGDTGFHLWLEEGQSASLLFDAERGSTRVFVPEDSPGEVLVDVLDSHISVLGGEWTVQELYVGENLIQVPPGSDIEIQRVVSEELPSEEPPERRRPDEVFVLTPSAMPLPTDEPFEDAGDILEVANVSPSQPQ